MLSCLTVAVLAKDTRPAQTAAESFLAQCDKGQYAAAYAASSGIIRKAVKAEQFKNSLAAVRGSLGKVVSRKLASATEATTLPGVPEGHYVVLSYNTRFEKRAAIETITPCLEGGSWKVSGYYIK